MISMLVVRQHSFGGPDVLRLEEVADPEPPQGHVRIRVEAAGVHLLDTVIRRGLAGGSLPLPELPFTPGREVAGVVDEVGPGVEERWLDRRVVADLSPLSGGYAELAVARADALHELPPALEADQAVAMVGTGRTAIAILELAAPTADDVAVVTAAAGGIGSLLVQAIHAAGGTVVGLAGGREKVRAVRGFGGADAVDYAKPGWEQRVREFLGDRSVTLALDGVGGEIGRATLELLGVGGRLVLFGQASGSLTQLTAEDLFARGITASAAVGARIMRRPGGLRPLESKALAAAADGTLTPLLGQPFGLADARAAHEAIESRATIGKTLLKPGPITEEH
jgi:NADPH:quinone reductase